MSAPTDPAGRLRAPTVVVVAGLLVVALVVTLLVTRLASGSDADAAVRDVRIVPGVEPVTPVDHP